MVCEAGEFPTPSQSSYLYTNTWQVTNFLNTMANEIDLKSPPVVEKPDLVHGQTSDTHKDAAIESTAASFTPMQRKLTLPIIN